eukprot:5593-Heterococcus_DN1.PRE.12
MRSLRLRSIGPPSRRGGLVMPLVACATLRFTRELIALTASPFSARGVCSASPCTMPASALNIWLVQQRFSKGALAHSFRHSSLVCCRGCYAHLHRTSPRPRPSLACAAPCTAVALLSAQAPSHTWSSMMMPKACSLLESYSLNMRLVLTLLNDLQHSRTIMSRGAQSGAESAATKNQKAVEANVTVSYTPFPAAIMKSSIMLVLLFLLNLICQALCFSASASMMTVGVLALTLTPVVDAGEWHMMQWGRKM